MSCSRPLSRRGVQRIAPRFIGGLRSVSWMQPREGRQKTARLRVVSSYNLNAMRAILSSLTGLISSGAQVPTVETVGYCRVSLAGQRPGDPEMRSHPC